MEIRRIQVAGGSSFAVTLPREWIRSMDLKKNDPVRVTHQSDGTLRISARLSEQPARRTRVFDVSSCTCERALFRRMIGAYIAGYTEIVVSSKSPLRSFVRGVIRDYARVTIGQAVIEETETTARILDLINPNEMPLESSLRRMVGIARGMHQDAIQAVAAGDPGLVRSVIERDVDVDRLEWLIARQANAVLKNPTLVQGTGPVPIAVVNHALVARVVERIADHAVMIAESGDPTGGRPFDPDVVGLIEEASSFSLEVFDRAMDAFFSHDPRRADDTIEVVVEAETRCREIEVHARTLATGPAVALGSIAGSIRRLAEYSGDIAELVIDDAVDRGS